MRLKFAFSISLAAEQSPPTAPETNITEDLIPIGAFLIHNGETDLCLGVRSRGEVNANRNQRIAQTLLISDGLYSHSVQRLCK